MPTQVKYIVKTKSRYGLAHFLGDVFLTVITGGLWLIWLLFKAASR